MTFVATGIVVVLLVLVACALVRYQPGFRRLTPSEASSLPASPDIARMTTHFLRTRYFQKTLPLFLAIPMVTTALVFHQALIAHATGMSLQWFAASFTGYAVAKVVSSLLVGPAIDRFGAAHLFTFHRVPMILGVVVLIIGASPATSTIYWMLLGLSSGMSGALQATIVAARISRSELGAARSLLASIAIVASAVGPVIYRLVLAAGVPLSELLWGTACVLAFVTWVGASAERI